MKRHVKVSVSQQFNYHLEAFNHLVKMLYPKRQSLNKYQYLITKNTPFTTEQQKVLMQTAHSLCMVNEFYRDQDKLGCLYVTREDIANAINLLQNELNLSNRSLLLSPVLQWYKMQLQYHFSNESFTVKQVQLRLQKSKTRIYEVLRELEYRKIITMVGVKHHAHVFQLKESL